MTCLASPNVSILLARFFASWIFVLARAIGAHHCVALVIRRVSRLLSDVQDHWDPFKVCRDGSVFAAPSRRCSACVNRSHRHVIVNRLLLVAIKICPRTLLSPIALKTLRLSFALPFVLPFARGGLTRPRGIAFADSRLASACSFAVHVLICL